MPDPQVCVRFLETSDHWTGDIRFGFTSNDPINLRNDPIDLRNDLPDFVCPDLSRKPGYWTRVLTEGLAERDTVFFYYVTDTGDVYFGVNGEEKGVYFSGVETHMPLWAIIDVYGNSMAIEFVDPNKKHFNNIRRGAEYSNNDNDRNAGHDVERILGTMQSLSILAAPAATT